MVVVVGMLYDMVARVLKQLCVHGVALLWNRFGSVLVCQYVVPRDAVECCERW